MLGYISESAEAPPGFLEPAKLHGQITFRCHGKTINLKARISRDDNTHLMKNQKMTVIKIINYCFVVIMLIMLYCSISR